MCESGRGRRRGRGGSRVVWVSVKESSGEGCWRREREGLCKNRCGYRCRCIGV